MQKEIFYTCLLIGLKNKQLLINRRHDFVIPEGVLLLNYLDDTVIDDVDQAEIQRAQNELQQIELYLNQTMANRIESNINVYSSNIPSWASAVAELLNRRNNKDWRLLARQLGFTLTEIRHWLMQKNPCMVLLDEWFTTHETDEAVLSLLKALGEIDRHDVEQIIQEAVLATGQIIPTDLSIDIKRRPLINLSFHSSKKDLVTKLKEHLAAAGYICQMYDEHIELNTTHTYICGAKVIICCVNRFYTQSENCCHVFQLILNMKKPFLLLHMDEQTWLPSEGIFQSIFQDYSSIEFANSQNDINWSEKKFIELLAHIRYYVAPDSDIIKEQYYHWFVPRLNDLIFLKSASDFISFDNIPLVVVHPQIIISYQWDSQKDVLHLYKLMTQLGYRIWLDLFQMTGGGTLTEKYDSTIRHATCLLVCLTPKYMKSMHCQHQLSLASTLKKPILPLLLEETRAWAPSNLKLSLPIEKLSLIDFQQSNANDRWTGKQFEMLLAYLEQIVSTVQTNKSRYFLDIYRPASASRNRTDFDQSPKRPSSAPLVPQSQACSVM